MTKKDTNPRPISRALLSVSDKTGLVELGKFLNSKGVELLSTGGTAHTLRDAGIEVKDVSQHTQFPEMLDGRVKTLHPKVHGGILGMRGNPAHQEAMWAHDIQPIDLVVVNLYPFEQTVAGGSDFYDCIENIYIGGPALIRAAAKNHADVAVVVESADYQKIMDEMTALGGTVSAALRRSLAAKAYARTGAYDSAIASWFAGTPTIRSTNASTSSSRCSESTARWTRPIRSASRPSIRSPVKSIRLACSAPTRYTHIAVVGQPQTRAGG